MKYTIWIVIVAGLALCEPTGAEGREAGTVPVEPAPALAPEATSGTGWVVKSGDNLCGLSDPKKLSNPAKVRYDDLKAATPEIQKMKDKNIDPDSPEGIQLKQAAVDRIRNASDTVRGEQGHCSVWKKIRHKDGRTIPDITDLVKKKF